ncbi:hypothetical protein BGZ98_008308 [Dissophora globulifera]|nr:hypothetical protein BGZ98_008308 [Dissophora globulifera]
MAKVKKQSSKKSTTGKKRVLGPSASSSTSMKHTPVATSSRGRRRKEAAAPATSTAASASKTRKATASSASSLPTGIPRRKEDRVLSDEESDYSGDEEEHDSDPDDHDLQLGLQRRLRVVKKSEIEKRWKPIAVKTRTHVQTILSNLFPAAISRARGEKRKIAVQITLNRMMQKLAEQDEAELENFEKKKEALDSWTNRVHRSKLHPMLRDPSLSTTMAALCAADNDFSHLSPADQRLMASMPMLRDEGFAAVDAPEKAYNPDQDLKINKISKRLGGRLSSIERNTEGLDPLMQLIAAAQDRVHELSRSTLDKRDTDTAVTRTMARRA